MMKIKNILLILGILTIVSTFVISTSFAATETITKSKTQINDHYKIKISDWNIITKTDTKGNDQYYNKFTIRDDKQKQYRIKSVIMYYQLENGTDMTKTYNGNKKLSLTIKNPKNIYSQNFTINYYSTTKTKSEKTYQSSNNDWYRLSYFSGKTATIKTLEKGYRKVTGMGFIITTYNKFQINSKYKIKQILTRYTEMVSGENSYKIFKGYEKTKLTITTPAKYKQLYTTGFKIYY